MTLHPQARAALAQRPTQVLTLESLAAGRAERDDPARDISGPPTPVASLRDHDAGGVRVRVYDPRPGENAPILVYIHGGGFVACSVETPDGLCRRIAAASGCAVYSVGYRLAPEHPWPAAIEDVETAIAWLRRAAPGLGHDASRIAIGGDSVGGNLAAVVARRARDAGTPFAYQVLLYPVIDALGAPTLDPAAGSGTGLTAADLAFYWGCYLPEGADRTHQDISPLRAADLTGLPPALIITAEHDVLCAEGEAYAQALAEAGVPTVASRYQGMIHGFMTQLAVYDAAPVAADQVAAALRNALGPPT